MTSAAQRKGDHFERLIRDYFRDELGVGDIVRNRMEGKLDRGDLGGVPGWTFQLKSYADFTRAVREGLIGLAHQKGNTRTPYGAVIVKRRGRSAPGEQLVVMSLADAMPLIRETAAWRTERR